MPNLLKTNLSFQIHEFGLHTIVLIERICELCRMNEIENEEHLFV